MRVFISLEDRKDVDARDQRGHPGNGGLPRFVCGYAATSARTRNGLPDPFSILSGVVISTAPVGGS